MIDDPAIFVIDDDPVIVQIICEHIEATWPKAKAFTFHNADQLFNDPDPQQADLFICDIRLGDTDGRILMQQLPEACHHTPILFISGYDTTDAEFEGIEKLYTYDFIAKPFVRRVLINRMRLLLNFKFRYQILNADKSAAEQSLLNLFDLSPILAVVLTDNMVVKYCNQQIIDFLQIKPEDILGQNFLAFLPETQKAVTYQMHRAALDQSARWYSDFEGEIIAADGRRQMARWFNTVFEGESEPLILSVGLIIAQYPVTNEKQFREFWLRELMNHKAMIRAIRQRIATRRPPVECDLKP